MKSKIVVLVLLGLTNVAIGQDEYFVDLSPEARALSKELKANARLSENRFDADRDVSTIPSWFVGSCHTESGEYHLVAYFSSPSLAHIGVFRGDKQLANLWRFPYDARQFYVEGTKLMFVARARLHEDTQETWRKVPREVVIDFAAIPKSNMLAFHGNVFEVAK
jgi:hypothetical protein